MYCEYFSVQFFVQLCNIWEDFNRQASRGPSATAERVATIHHITHLHLCFVILCCFLYLVLWINIISTIGDQLDGFTYLVACHYCYTYYDFVCFFSILWQINSLAARRTTERDVLLGVNDHVTGHVVSRPVDAVRPAEHDVDRDELVRRRRQLHHGRCPPDHRSVSNRSPPPK